MNTRLGHDAFLYEGVWRTRIAGLYFLSGELKPRSEARNLELVGEHHDLLVSQMNGLHNLVRGYKGSRGTFLENVDRIMKG